MLKRIIRCIKNPPLMQPGNLRRVSADRIKQITQTWTRSTGYVAVLAPWPWEDSVNQGDGYIKRIAMIDESVLFPYQRIYLYNSPFWTSRYLGAFITEQQNVCYLIFNDSRISHVSLVKEIIFRAKLCYVHSIFRLLPSVDTDRPVWIMKPDNLTTPMVVDLHGAVPAEMTMHGHTADKISWAYSIEEACLRDARLCIGVSQAMIRAFTEEHHICPKESVVIPITGNVAPMATVTKPTGKTTILYSGGVQAWQRIDEMLMAVEQTTARNLNYDFCVNDVHAFAAMLAQHSCTKSINYARQTKETLLEHYLQANFGFILRDDSLVNRVACPTKLIEYLQNGIVPILKTAAIGDFENLGMQYVKLEDFVRGQLPNERECSTMQQANARVLERLEEERQGGLHALRTIIAEILGAKGLT